MGKIRLSSQKIKDSGHRVTPLTSWYFVDGSYLLITLTKKGRVICWSWVMLVLPMILLKGVLGGLALMLNWLADHIELFPSWYIFPLSKDVVVRVKDDKLKYWQDMEDK